MATGHYCTACQLLEDHRLAGRSQGLRWWVGGMGQAMSQLLHFKTGMMMVTDDSFSVEKPMFHGDDLIGHH